MTDRPTGAKTEAEMVAICRGRLTDALEAAQAGGDPRLYLQACATLLWHDGTTGAAQRARRAAEVSVAMLGFYDVRRAEGEPAEDAVMGAAFDTLSAAMIAAMACQTLLGPDAFAEVWNKFAAQLVEEDGAAH